MSKRVGRHIGIQTKLNHRRRNVFERAVYVYKNRMRLGYGTPLDAKRMATLIQNPERLIDAVKIMHAWDRKKLGPSRRFETRQHTDKISRNHAFKLSKMIAAMKLKSRSRTQSNAMK